jgi:hypothetical protein
MAQSIGQTHWGQGYQASLLLLVPFGTEATVRSQCFPATVALRTCSVILWTCQPNPSSATVLEPDFVVQVMKSCWIHTVLSKKENLPAHKT